MVGAALIVALVSATTVANASTKFDYTTSIDDTGELVVVFDEGSLKRFDGVAYRLEAFGEMVTPTRILAGQALVETESPLVPDTSGRVTGSLTTSLGLLFLAPCGCSGGRYFEYTKHRCYEPRNGSRVSPRPNQARHVTRDAPGHR